MGKTGLGLVEGVQDGTGKRPRRRGRSRLRIGLRLALFLGLLALAVGLAGMALTGRALGLPVWAVADIERRMNAALGASHLPEGAALSLGGVEVALDRDLTPRFVLRDLRLIEAGGGSLLALPEIRASLDPGALLTGQVRPQSVRVTGARIAIARDAEGRIALSFGGLSGAPQVQGAAQILDALDRMFSSPALSGLRLIEAEALTLGLQDARAGRRWEVGDGRLVIENRDDALAAELSLTLLDGATPAQARLVIETDKADSSARLGATVDRVAAADLAAQAAPLAFFGLLDAPISGRLSGTLDDTGAVGPLEGDLTVEAGTLKAGEKAAPVAFDRAGLALRYDPGRQRVTLDRMAVESASLRFAASGTVDLLDKAGGPAAAGALPAALVTQLAVSDLRVDPEGLFEAPARFSGGAISARLWLRPFRVDIGEVSLTEGDERLSLSGRLAALDSGGWQGALDVALNRIGTERMIRLWPVSVVPKTRAWLAANVGQGELSDVTAALRLAPGEEPRFALDYEFSGAEVRVVRTLPPVQDGHGRAGVQGNAYTVVLEGGHVTAPEGGRIAVAGTVFRVPDITQRPAAAEVRLVTDAALTATLSLLDQEPFRFISKAGREVDLGEGRARLVSELRFPLVAKVLPGDVGYDVTGTITGFRSDRLVPGRVVAAGELAVAVTPEGMRLEGAGTLDGVPMRARYDQAFGPEAKGRATVTGTARISDAGLRKLGVALPKGWLKGETAAEVTLQLAKGRPAELALTSTLKGAVLAVPALSWSKPAGATGKLELAATLGPAPEVTSLALTAPGLTAEGSLTTRKGGGLGLARFPRLEVGDWLDASAEVEGRGKSVAVRLTGGTLDLRRRPKGGDGGGDGGRIAVNLDRLQVSSGIALTGFSGEFTSRGGGLDGGFIAAVNGAGRIAGTTLPVRDGTAVRITSDDAGSVMAAAGIFGKGRGGRLDLTLQPRGGEGAYTGIASFTRLSVQGAPALAELLSAASVIGLLEQLNGQGILFNEGDMEFQLRPEGVQITRGAAVGASMGISFAGLYRADSGTMDIQGTISPVYLLNGIGQIFTPRRGEGLFGFTYRLTGSAADPQVSVNPLSILTPGMFREIFRRPAPVLEGNG